MTDRRAGEAVLVWATTAAAVAMSLANPRAGLPMLDTVSIGAILLLGLPHGALDLVELRADPAIRSRPATILLVYLLVLAGAALAWWIDAGLALAGFLILAVAHFAIEWRNDLPRSAAWPAAALIVAGPAATRPNDVTGLFAALCGDPALAATLARVAEAAALPLMLVLVLAIVRTPVRRVEIAILAAIGLGVLLLAPLHAFAIFFALVHSPRHLAGTLSRFSWSTGTGYRRALPMTLAALLIFALLLVLPVRSNPQSAVFMLLAILAVPHMLVGKMLRAPTKRAARVRCTLRRRS